MRIAITPSSAVFLLSTVLVAASLLPVQRASAQSAAPCPTIENDAERLACYDRALRPNPPAKAEEPSRRQERAAATPSRPPAAASAPTAASSPAPAVAPTDRASRREREARATRESTPAAPPAPPQAAAPARAERSSRRGARDSEDEIIGTIVVAEVRAFTGRPSTFITDRGDVWTQIDTQRTVLPKTPFSATLKPGAMGSVFLVPENQNRAIRVHHAD
jgi:hypothetical protein